MKKYILELENISKELRKKIFRMAYKANGAHLGGAFSLVEILTVLFWGGILKYDPKNPKLPERDRFILSKGHACTALYAVLSKAGYLEEHILDTFCQKGSILGGHPNMLEVPGIEASTGSLGHGLGFATGIALAAKIKKINYNVYVVLGDGECQEGSVWESILFSSQQKLGNLTVIVDNNKIQAMDRLETIVGMEPFADKWRSFGWNVKEVDGHDMEALTEALARRNNDGDIPLAIVAHTIKGKGVSFMENQPLWHYRMPDKTELELLLKELDINIQELI